LWDDGVRFFLVSQVHDAITSAAGFGEEDCEVELDWVSCFPGEIEKFRQSSFFRAGEASWAGPHFIFGTESYR
jgi:hypothetical protein